MDYRPYFESYVAAYNRALRGDFQPQRIRAFFSDKFLAATDSGLKFRRNNWYFSWKLKRLYAFYRGIGIQRMSVKSVHVIPIDPKHDMVKVFYEADCENNERKFRINFDVTYLLEKCGVQPQIFAYISQDEMKTLKDAGLVETEEPQFSHSAQLEAIRGSGSPGKPDKSVHEEPNGS